MIDLKKLRGLTAAEVETSRKTHGANLLTPPEKASLWSQFVEKFNDPLIKILLVALVLSIGISCYEVMALGEPATVFLEPLGIFIAITLATLVGFLVEVNANKKFEMLNKVNDDVPVKVLRNGNITTVPRIDVAPRARQHAPRRPRHKEAPHRGALQESCHLPHQYDAARNHCD